MATIELSNDSDEQILPELRHPYLQKFDRWCDSVGDRINPILVKETRQALQSRQFLLTFSLILLAAVGWTIGGSLSLMPNIYYQPSAPRMMLGFYLVLALPMILVVPVAAFRSMESEMEDGTMELLSISVLSPWQIVLGKLGSALLQMMLYLLILFPCMAYAYTLRGVELSLVLGLISSLFLGALQLTVLGIFLATVARSRALRTLNLLVLVATVFGSAWGFSISAFEFLFYGFTASAEELAFAAYASIGGVAVNSILLLTVAAALLKPESENRSTSIRLALLAMTGFTISTSVIGVYQFRTDPEIALVSYAVGTLFLTALWTVAGAMIVAEGNHMTARIRRELPSSFAGRLSLTWLTPGPTSGLVFVTSVIWLLAGLNYLGMSWIEENVRGLSMGGSASWMIARISVLVASYIICGLVLSRGLMYLIRLSHNPRPMFGIAMLAIVAIFSSLIPYSLQLHFNEYRQINYDATWQKTNWIFTMMYAANDRLVTSDVILSITAAAVSGTIIAWAAAARLTRPRKIATPENVLEAQKLRPQDRVVA